MRSANALATGGLVPDLTVLLTLSPAAAEARRAARGVADRLERYGEAFDARVADAYAASVTPAWQAAHPECGPIVAVPADGAVAAITSQVLATIVELASANAVLTA